MKKQIFNFAFSLSILFLITGCPLEEGPYHDMEEYVINNSQDTIIWRIKASSNINDSSLWALIPWEPIEKFAMPPGYIDTITFGSHSTKEFFKDKCLHYYFFYYDSVATIPWDQIRDEYIIAKRVTICSWEEYEDMDFTISFP